MTSKRTLEAIEQLTADDHPTATDWQNRAYRAEAECKELRERLVQAKADMIIALEMAIDATLRKKG